MGVPGAEWESVPGGPQADGRTVDVVAGGAQQEKVDARRAEAVLGLEAERGRGRPPYSGSQMRYTG
jgi:hypothetical protein